MSSVGWNTEQNTADGGRDAHTDFAKLSACPLSTKAEHMDTPSARNSGPSRAATKMCARAQEAAYSRRFAAAVFRRVKHGELSKCPSTVPRVKKLQDRHSKEHCPARRRNQ